jgi:hypothetical protein
MRASALKYAPKTPARKRWQENATKTLCYTTWRFVCFEILHDSMPFKICLVLLTGAHLKYLFCVLGAYFNADAPSFMNEFTCTTSCIVEASKFAHINSRTPVYFRLCAHSKTCGISNIHKEIIRITAHIIVFCSYVLIAKQTKIKTSL